VSEFATKRQPNSPDAVAPDGSDVRILLALSAGSMAHFELAPGRTSVAVAHRTVEEIWYFLGGRGEMWRRQGDREEVVTVEAGVCVTIPLGTAFQFRCLGDQPLSAVAVTMPPWPGAEEAYAVVGRWPTNSVLNANLDRGLHPAWPYTTARNAAPVGVATAACAAAQCRGAVYPFGVETPGVVKTQMRRRRLVWLTALVLVTACVTPAVLWVLGQLEHFRERQAGRDLVVQLQQRRPADVDAQTWEWATNWAVTAYGNVCASPEHVSLEELRRFNTDLAERLLGPVDLATVDWVWDHLGRTGPHGRSYREQFEPQYRAGLGVAGRRPPRDAAPD
jgi:mannose-6-phosphate isomerase-like protein (cupin superfamily)